MSTQQINFRIESNVLAAIKAEAQKTGVGYSRWIIDAAVMRLQGTLLSTLQNYPAPRSNSKAPQSAAIQSTVQHDAQQLDNEQVQQLVKAQVKQQIELVKQEWQQYIAELVEAAIQDVAIQVNEVKADVGILEERLAGRTAATDANLSNVLDGIQRLNAWIVRASQLIQNMRQQIGNTEQADRDMRSLAAASASQLVAIQHRFTELESRVVATPPPVQSVPTQPTESQPATTTPPP